MPVEGVLAVVVDRGPRSASGLRLFGRPLVAHALESVQGVQGLDVAVVAGRTRGVPPSAVLAPDAPWRGSASSGLLVHDPMCPLLPSSAVRECLAALRPDGAVVGLRPVTDTIKQVDDGCIVGTVDRERLAALASPLVVGEQLLDRLAEAFPLAGDLADLPQLVEFVAGAVDVVEVVVPSLARRITDDDDVALLECLHALRRTLPER